MSIGSADGLENSSSRDSEATLLSSSGYFFYFQKKYERYRYRCFLGTQIITDQFLFLKYFLLGFLY